MFTKCYQKTSWHNEMMTQKLLQNVCIFAYQIQALNHFKRSQHAGAYSFGFFILLFYFVSSFANSRP